MCVSFVSNQNVKIQDSNFIVDFNLQRVNDKVQLAITTIMALMARHILNQNTEIDTQHSKGMLSGAGLNLIRKCL